MDDEKVVGASDVDDEKVVGASDVDDEKALGASIGTKPKKLGHRWKMVIDPAWLNTYLWIPAAEGDMLCRKHGRRPKCVAFGKAACVDMPCISVRIDVVQKHSTSDVHQLEMALVDKVLDPAQ